MSVSTSSRSNGHRAAASRTSTALLKVTTPLNNRDAQRSRHRRASSGPPAQAMDDGPAWGPCLPSGCRPCRPMLPGVDDQGQPVTVGQIDLPGECLALDRTRRMVVVVIEAALADGTTTGRSRSSPARGRGGGRAPPPAARRGNRHRRPRRGGGGRPWPIAPLPRPRPPNPVGAWPYRATASADEPAPVPTQTILDTPASAARRWLPRASSRGGPVRRHRRPRQFLLEMAVGIEPVDDASDTCSPASPCAAERAAHLFHGPTPRITTQVPAAGSRSSAGDPPRPIRLQISSAVDGMAGMIRMDTIRKTSRALPRIESTSGPGSPSTARPSPTRRWSPG